VKAKQQSKYFKCNVNVKSTSSSK